MEFRRVLFRSIAKRRMEVPEVAAALAAIGVGERGRALGWSHGPAPGEDHHSVVLDAEDARSLASALGITPVLRPTSSRKIAASLSFGKTSQRGAEHLDVWLHLRNLGPERVALRWMFWHGSYWYRFDAEPPLPLRPPPTGHIGKDRSGSYSSARLAPGAERVVKFQLDTAEFALSDAGRHEITLDFELIAPEDAVPANAPCSVAAKELIVRAKGTLILE
jgi:hypothetical protein